jgi:thymidylate synthase (FAD)
VGATARPEPDHVLLMHEVALIDSMASDLHVVNAARVSFAKRVTTMSDGDAALIRYLMKHRHGTPFEHGAFMFRITCPIFVAREWFRHRIGSFNEQSGRYSELEMEFFLPEKARTQVGKPGAYAFEEMAPEDTLRAHEIMSTAYTAAAEAYQSLLELGVAKELSSRVLPVATKTQFIWTVNPRSLMNFLSLRNAPQAQFEIRQYAQNIELHFQAAMPETYAAFVDNGRVAP